MSMTAGGSWSANLGAEADTDTDCDPDSDIDIKGTVPLSGCNQSFRFPQAEAGHQQTLTCFSGWLTLRE
jgi:hypothetical protein